MSLDVRRITLWEMGHSIPTEEAADFAATFLREFPVEEYPYLAELVKQHFTESSLDDEGGFEFGLDLILDGLTRIRGTDPSKS